MQELATISFGVLVVAAVLLAPVYLPYVISVWFKDRREMMIALRVAAAGNLLFLLFLFRSAPEGGDIFSNLNRGAYVYGWLWKGGLLWIAVSVCVGSFVGASRVRRAAALEQHEEQKCEQESPGDAQKRA
jgi:hypothetical protein